jgi:hypothetical protein
MGMTVYTVHCIFAVMHICPGNAQHLSFISMDINTSELITYRIPTFGTHTVVGNM